MSDQNGRSSWSRVFRDGKVLFLILVALVFGGTARELISMFTGGLVNLPDSPEQSQIKCVQRAVYADLEDEDLVDSMRVRSVRACVPPASEK